MREIFPNPNYPDGFGPGPLWLRTQAVGQPFSLGPCAAELPVAARATGAWRDYHVSPQEASVLRIPFTAACALLVASAAAGQTPPPPAVDVTAADITAFIEGLPKDRVSDLPIRVADVGGYKVGVYGVFRPKSVPGDAILHETSVTEIYYVLEGTGTLVTGGTLANERPPQPSPNTKRPNRRGDRIDGGVSRKVGPGDVVIIPGRVPHWWSALDGDIKYLIYRPDPEGLQPTK